MTVGLIGIVLAFALLLVLTFKNVSTIVSAMLSVIVVVVFNNLSMAQALTETYVGGVVDIIAVLFMMILLGTILGQIYTETGAAVSIANTFINVFVNKAEGEKQIRVACAVIIIVSCLFQFGGIDSFVVLFTTFPIVVTMWRRLNLPRRMIPGMLLCSTGVGACAGAPTVHNVLPMTILGTTSTAGAIPGIIAFLIIEIGAWFMISTMVIRAVRKGEAFDEEGMQAVPDLNADSTRKLPNFVVSLLPLIFVFVLFSIVKMNITFALSGGIILALLLMGKNIRLEDQPQARLGTQVIATLNRGAGMSTKALIEISVIGGLAAVVASTAAFGELSTGLMGLEIHPYLIVLISVFILVAMTSSPPAGLSIIIPIFATSLIAQTGALGIAALPEAVHRICSTACLTFETLPWNGMIVVALGLANVKHKDGYLPMFFASVLFPVIGAVVATILLIAFPGLA